MRDGDYYENRPHELWVTVDLLFITGQDAYDIRRMTHLQQTANIAPSRRHVSIMIAVSESLPLLALAALLAKAGLALAFVLMAVAMPLAIGLALLVASAFIRLWPPVRELAVNYDGELLVLYRTRDDIELGKLRRAMVRAMEDALPYRTTGTIYNRTPGGSEPTRWQRTDPRGGSPADRDQDVPERPTPTDRAPC
jgi:hypothetical protein